MHHASQEADKEVYKNIDPKSSELYRLANQLRKENADVVGDKPVKNDAGEMSMSDDSKQKAWLEHYQRLLNAEFDWDPNHLSDESPVEGPPIPITWQLQSSVMARYPPTGSRVSLSVSTRVRGMHWKGVTIVVSS